MAEFFGFEIKRKGEDGKELPSFVPNTDDDGVGVISTGGHFGQYVDIDGDTAKNVSAPSIAKNVSIIPPRLVDITYILIVLVIQVTNYPF